MRIKCSKEEIVDINLTPIIDMVFLLLIFFLVATKFSDLERDVRVDPPSSRNTRPVTAMSKEIVVNVTTEGRFLIAGVALGVNELEQVISTAVAKNPKQSVVIRGDKKAMLQFAVNVLELCERHGIVHTYLTTRLSEGR